MSVPDTGIAPIAAPPPVRRRIPRWWWAVGLVAVLALLSLLEVLTDANDLASSGTIRATLIATTPILLAALGGLWSERAGVVNIGLEGMMILGTFGAAWWAYEYGAWVGVLGAILFGALGGALHGVATVIFGVDHIVSGVAINILALGVTRYLAPLAFEGHAGGSAKQSPAIDSLGSFTVPGLSDGLRDLNNQGWFFISDIAGLLGGLVTNVSWLTLIAIALIPGTWWILWRTAFGLRLRSCGENPVAAESLGVNVYLHKYVAVVISGAFAGMGGASLVLLRGGADYLENQTNGRGYIGLAAMIFGNWRPGGLLGGAALFGYADGLQLAGGGEAVLALLYGAVILVGVIVVVQLFRRQWIAAGLGVVGAGVLYAIYWANDTLPSDLIPYTAHFVTLIVLAVASQRLRPPKADGQPYRRGED